MTALLTAWKLIKEFWQVALGVAIAIGVLLLKLKWTNDGQRKEQEAQQQRNRDAENRAERARDSALGSDDPRRDLLRDFRRADGQ